MRMTISEKLTFALLWVLSIASLASIAVCFEIATMNAQAEQQASLKRFEMSHEHHMLLWDCTVKLIQARTDHAKTP